MSLALVIAAFGTGTYSVSRPGADTYTDGFIAESEHFFGQWGQAGEVNMLEVGNEVTLYTSTRCLLGDKMRFKLSKEFSELYADLEGGINVISFFAPYLPLPAMRRRDKARVKMVELIEKIVAERRNDPHGHEDILQTLVESNYADGRKLSADTLRQAYATMLEQDRGLQPRYLPEIQQKASTLDLNEVIQAARQ